MSDSPNVDTVKKQILMIKQLREEAEDKAEKAEAKCQELQKTYDLVSFVFTVSSLVSFQIHLLFSNSNQKTEERSDLLKRIAQLERDLVDVKESLEVGNAKLEEASKVADSTEKEKNELIKKIMGIEEQIDKSEEKLTQTQQALKEATHLADENERLIAILTYASLLSIFQFFLLLPSIIRQRQAFEHRYQQDLLKTADLERQLQEAQGVAEIADKRYDEVCKKVAVFESDLERNEERADSAEV